MPAPEIAEAHPARGRFRRRVEGKPTPRIRPIFGSGKLLPTAPSLGAPDAEVTAVVAMIIIIGWLFLPSEHSFIRICIISAAALSVRVGLYVHSFEGSDFTPATRSNLPLTSGSFYDVVVVNLRMRPCSGYGGKPSDEC